MYAANDKEEYYGARTSDGKFWNLKLKKQLASNTKP